MLFTAFEPSGDNHAAPVIAELKRRRPDLRIFGWGGPRMREAGAEIIEETGQNAAMGAGGFAKVFEHLAINKRIRAWVETNRPALHVPVDSPAANFPICKITKPRGATVIHLVAPQLWAWGEWRVAKLRRLTDLVLCLLPFEEAFFARHGVPARFIGHPVLGEPSPAAKFNGERAPLPSGRPRLAILPGSRPGEIRANTLAMLAVFESVRRAHPTAHAAVAAAGADAERRIHHAASNLPAGVVVESGRLHEILDWADAAIVCSGTGTLDVVRHRTPMVVLFRMSPVPWWLVGRWLISTPFKALPNLIAGRRVVPEFIPSYGSLDPVVTSLRTVIEDDATRNEQVQAFREIRAQFERTDYAATAADEILGRLDRSSGTKINESHDSFEP